MRITGLKFKDFCSYGETDMLDLSTINAVIITGRNGAGKSTILKGIRWCLWGFTEAGLDDVIRLGQKEAQVTVEFIQGGANYRVTRTRTKTAKTATSSLDFEIQIEGRWESRAGTGLTDTEKRIIQILGLDYELAAATSFAEQDNWAAICKATPLERRTILARLAGLDAWADYRVIVRNMGRTIKGQLDGLIIQIDRLQPLAATVLEKAESLTGFRVDLENAIQAALTSEESYQKAAEAHQKAIKTHADIGAARQRMNDAQTRLDALNRNKLNKADDLKILADDIAEFKPVNVELAADKLTQTMADQKAANEKKTAAYDALATAQGNVGGTTIKIRAAQDRIADLQESASRAAAETENNRMREIAAAEREVRNAESQLETLTKTASRLATVPCAGAGEYAGCSLISIAVDAQKDVPAAKTAVETAKANLETLREKYKNHVIGVVAPEIIDPIQKQITGLKSELEELKMMVEVAQITFDGAREDYETATDNVEKSRRESDTATAEARRQENRRAMHKAARDNLIEIEGTIIDQEGVVKKLQADPLLTTPDVDNLEQAKWNNDSAYSAMQEKQTSRETCRVHVSQQEKDLVIAENAATEIGLLSTNADELRQKLADCNDLDVAYRDVPTLIIETIVPEIESEANALLEKVSSSGLSLALITQKAAKDGSDKVVETMDLLVRDTAGERPYEVYSGGERFRITWAFRVALAHVLTARAGISLDTMTLDEGFGSLDQEGLSAFTATMAETTAMFGLTMVISHVGEMTDAFPHRLRVVKTENGSVWQLED
jgi:exonuclease SbcC